MRLLADVNVNDPSIETYAFRILPHELFKFGTILQTEVPNYLQILLTAVNNIMHLRPHKRVWMKRICWLC